MASQLTYLKNFIKKAQNTYSHFLHTNKLSEKQQQAVHEEALKEIASRSKILRDLIKKHNAADIELGSSTNIVDNIYDRIKNRIKIPDKNMYTTGQVYSQQLTPPWYRRLIGEKAIPSQIVKVTKLDGFNPMENNSMDLSQYVVTNNPDKVPKWFIDKVKAMQTGKGSTYINDNIIADK